MGSIFIELRNMQNSLQRFYRFRIFDNVLPMMNKWFLVERGFCKKQYQTYLNAVNGLLQ